MKIIKRAVLWLSIMLVLELLINAVGAFIVKRVGAENLINSMSGYSKRTEMILHPTFREENDGKANGLSGLAVRTILSDGRLYNHTKFGYNFLFLNFTMEQSVVFFDKDGTTQVSSGIFNIAYEDRGSKTDYIKFPVGIIDVKELCAQSNAEELYSALEKKQYDSIRLDEYSVDEDYIVRPKKMTLLDPDKNAIQSFEFPCEGEIIKDDSIYVYDMIKLNEQMRNSSTSLCKKMKDVYDGKLKTDKTLADEQINVLKNAGYDVTRLDGGKKLVLITGHRRENFGDGFISMVTAMKDLSEKYPEVDFVYPMHLNPNVRKPIHEVFGEDLTRPNFFFIEPLQYLEFVYLMEKSTVVLTDSGGIQEEAPGLGKPVLVMRDTTERPEALKSGTVHLVGTNHDLIVSEVSTLLDDAVAYEKMSKAVNPYGDGKACNRIVRALNGEAVDRYEVQ